MSNSRGDIYSVGEIKDIKENIKTLHTICRELSKRIAKIENLNIQHQISSFHDSLLETQRMLAHFFILQVSTTIENSSKEQKPRISNHFLEQLNIDTASAVAKAKTSNEPLDVVREFVDKACEDARSLGVQLLMF